MTRVAPSMLAADFTRLGDQLQMLEAAGADMLHLDVMDGHFVPNLTFGPFIIKQIDSICKLPLDVHLMISNPEKYIDAYADAGADCITVHGEVIGNDPSLLKQIRAHGIKAGMSLNPDAEFDDYTELFGHLDLFLVMSVHAGFGGQKFIQDMLEKVRKAKQFRRKHNLNFEIAIDGGIDTLTAPLAREAGVDILVAGTALFGAVDVAKFIAALRGDTP